MMYPAILGADSLTRIAAVALSTERTHAFLCKDLEMLGLLFGGILEKHSLKLEWDLPIR